MVNYHDRIFACPYRGCGYYSDRRWALESHLWRMHDLSKKEARDISYRCCYIMNPTYHRAPGYDRERRESGGIEGG